MAPQKIDGTVYVMPKEFLLNMADGRYAKLDVALVLDKSVVLPAVEGASADASYGALEQEPAVRDVITNVVTDAPSTDLIDRDKREALQDRDPQANPQRHRCEGQQGAVHRRRGAVGESHVQRDRIHRCSSPAGWRRTTAADLHRLEDVPVELAVEIGRTHMTIGETLGLGPGSIVEPRTAWRASRSTCW